MDIKNAKEQIKNAVIAYRTKDRFGRPVIPVERQRPIFLVGAPGIGKTAIVEQIAKEMGIGLVSYSITHHTRQSALGLPFIAERDYGGRPVRTSEYTMSEIIASVYKKMEETGVQEGILFLDEINCVSETLMPAMLQFLQYKVFGQHRVPEGWMVVTAGNPPEYNSAVREFDMVTSDRLKRIEVEPDYEVWKNWAENEGVHPAVLSYLGIRREHFYHIETDIDGRRFVTPRGWVDLSAMIGLYEKNGLKADGLLFGQYLQDAGITRSFASYYDLWQKYQADYGIRKIAEGISDAELTERARRAAFDERVTLVDLLFAEIKGRMAVVTKKRALLAAAREKILKAEECVKAEEMPETAAAFDSFADFLEKEARGEQSKLQKDDIITLKLELEGLLREYAECVKRGEDIRTVFRKETADLKEQAASCGAALENIFTFLEQTFGAGPEIQLMMTKLTGDLTTAEFISRYGSEAYYRWNRELLFYERGKELIRQIEETEGEA